MRLRTSRWILRVLLLPFLLMMLMGILSYVLMFRNNPSLVDFLVNTVAITIPLFLIYVIWIGHQDSARISARRRRRHQASRDRAHLPAEPEPGDNEPV